MPAIRQCLDVLRRPPGLGMMESRFGKPCLVPRPQQLPANAHGATPAHAVETITCC